MVDRASMRDGTTIPEAPGPGDKASAGRLSRSRVARRVPGGTWSRSPCPCLPPDVDECAWDTDVCPGGQRCVNVLGSYRCLPDCGPGFRVAADGASCEGDRGMRGVVRAPGNPAVARIQSGRRVSLRR